MIVLATIYERAGVFIAGAVTGLVLWFWKNRSAKAAQFLQSKSLLDDAKREAESIVRDAKLAANEEALKLREQTEQSFAARRQERAEIERRLSERETMINSQFVGILASEKNLRGQNESLAQREKDLSVQAQEISILQKHLRAKLAGVSHLNEAKAMLLKEIEDEARKDGSSIGRRIIEDATVNAEEKARRIISMAIQRYAGDHAFESTTATIALTGEEMKGRIIGRDGRNIRAFEAETGVTVLIDDTPNAVVLSGFDPVKREIAREAMQRLITDGRIHPTSIEEIVKKVSGEMDETINRLGEEAVHKTGLPPMRLEIVRLLGKLHFRRSYSQNVLSHSVEVAHLMGLMAAELGLDISTAKRAGLLHDIGKAMSHEVEGPHAVIGAEFISQLGESDEVVNGVASHHNDVPPVGPLGILVSAADAISAARPGARSESMTTYLKRIEDLEKLALTFDGVDKVFAVQAGRELRVFVQPEKISDEKANDIARQIANKIQNELQYPGQIKITVIREKRCVEVAK